jgi:hypothetical protein
LASGLLRKQGFFGEGSRESTALFVCTFGRQAHPHCLVLDQKDTHNFLQTLDPRLPVFLRWLSFIDAGLSILILGIHV